MVAFLVLFWGTIILCKSAHFCFVLKEMCGIYFLPTVFAFMKIGTDLCLDGSRIPLKFLTKYHNFYIFFRCFISLCCCNVALFLLLFLSFVQVFTNNKIIV